MIGVGGLEYCRPEYKNHFHHNSFFASGGKTKQGISEGFIDVTPCCLSQVADILMNRLPKIDVFVGQMSPPDAHGYLALPGVQTPELRVAGSPYPVAKPQIQYTVAPVTAGLQGII